METKCDYDVTAHMLQTLEQSEAYKGIAAAAQARIDAGEDSDTVGRELLQTLSEPLSDGDHDAGYAIEAYMIGAFDLYYRDCWDSATGEMQELVDEVLADVVAGRMTPRAAAESWVATHTLRQYGYPAYDKQIEVALDVVYGRIPGNGIHNAMYDR